MRVVVDASALAAVVFDEDGRDEIVDRMHGATLHAPALLPLELANTALKKARKMPDRSREVFARLFEGLQWLSKIQYHEVNPVDVALLASVTGLSAYDASYMWLAGWLEADLMTLDKKLAAVTGFEVEPCE